MAERSFVVHGRVQGVGFRWWTRSQARRLGVTGTVSNRADGSVEVRARGSEEALAQFRLLLEQGPPGAEVTAVRESETSGTPTHPFEIVRSPE